MKPRPYTDRHSSPPPQIVGPVRARFASGSPSWAAMSRACTRKATSSQVPLCSTTCTWNSLGALTRTCLSLRSKDTMETDR
jgi:hypothetical protein